MIKKLNDFWKWLEKSPEEYSENGLDYFENYNRMEFDFPEFEELKICAYEIVNKNSYSKDDLYDLLTIMALDNQDHNILNYIAKHSSDEQLENIIEVGIFHLQFEARLQLPALLYRRKPAKFEKNLLILANDHNLRVKRRAQSALNFLSNRNETSKLDDFWLWLGKSEEKYGTEGVPQIYGREECDFPFFEDLLEYAKSIVDFGIMSDKEINDLFTIMAIDNESENTLDYIETHSSEEQLNKLISVGIEHIQYEGRWQLAELIYRRKVKNYENFLLFLSNDTNEVVSSRAKNLLLLLKDNYYDSSRNRD